MEEFLKAGIQITFCYTTRLFLFLAHFPLSSHFSVVRICGVLYVRHGCDEVLDP